MIIISLFLLGTVMPNLSFTAHVNVGIVNGREAKPHSRPYMVSLQEDGTHICGGFLISDKFVLTAAHCRDHALLRTVVVGAHDLTDKNNIPVHIDVIYFYKHPDYNKTTFQNDIMLVQLKKTVKENKNVKWISIPSEKEDIKAGSVCSVAGWGSSAVDGTFSARLMETDVKILSDTECVTKWKQDNYSASHMMCAYGDGGTCTGDSGGPLVCGDTAVGVTSFGDKKLCNNPDLPEIYTKISSYLPWIHKIIGNVN